MRLRACDWWLVVGIWLGLSAAATAQTFHANPATLGAIPDMVGANPGFKWVDIPVDYPPNFRVADVQLSLTMSHSFVGDLVVRLHTPFGSVESPIFYRVGKTTDPGYGDNSNLAGTYVFHNAAAGNFWASAAAIGDTSAVPGGEYRPSSFGSNGMPGPQTSISSYGIPGTWYVTINDYSPQDTGAITAASLTLTLEASGSSGSLGPIPESTTCGTPGSAIEVPIVVPPLAGTLRHVAASLRLTHTYVGDLTATLFAPNGDSHVLFGATGATAPAGNGDSSNLDGTYTFSDSGAPNWWNFALQLPTGGVMPAGEYRTSEPGGIGATGAATAMNPLFAGRDSQGIWTLRVTDRCPGDTGEVQYVTLRLLANQANDDSYTVAFGTTLAVPGPGILANDITSTASLKAHEIVTQPAHGGLLASTSGGFLYFPNSGYVGPDSFTYRGATLGAPSNVATVHLTVAPPAMTSGADAYATPFETPLTVAAPGVLANDTTAAGTLGAVLASSPVHGTVTLHADGSFAYAPAEDFAGSDTFTYYPSAFGAPGPAATVTIAVPAPTTAQPPKLFGVVHAGGSRVMLRWDPPRHGPAPTAFVLSGGVAPGQTLASLVLPADPPVLTIDLPPGVLYLRTATQTAAGTSAPSNELRVPVLVAEPPSPPAALTAAVSGGTLTLTWKDTFLGGAPGTVKHLDVSGALSATLPISAGETITVPGVPPGTYAIAVRGANAAGTSAPSPPVAVTLPAGCTGVPLPPHRFLAYRDGNAVGLLWEPPPTGPAPTTYELVVSGAYTGVVPMGMQRRLSAPVPPGSYAIAVRAANACGTGAATDPQVIVVP